MPVPELVLVLELAHVPELGKMKGQQRRLTETHDREQTDGTGALAESETGAGGPADCLSGNTKPESCQAVAKYQEGRCLQAEKLTYFQVQMKALDPVSELVAAAEDAGEKMKHELGESGGPCVRTGKMAVLKHEFAAAVAAAADLETKTDEIAGTG